MRSRKELRDELEEFLSGRRHTVFSEVEKTLRQIHDYLSEPEKPSMSDALREAWDVVSETLELRYEGDELIEMAQYVKKWDHAVALLENYFNGETKLHPEEYAEPERGTPTRLMNGIVLADIQKTLDDFDASEIDDVDCLCKIAEIMRAHNAENAENTVTDPRYSRDEDDEGPEGKCVLCGGFFQNRFDRNNPWPLATEGDCCAVCNMTKVVPERIRRVMGDGA